MLVALEQPTTYFGLAWCRGDQVDIYTFSAQFELVKRATCSAHLKNAHRKGGQSQRRFERLIEGQRHDYGQHVADTLCKTLDPHLLSLQRLFLVGHGSKHRDLQQRLPARWQPLCECVTYDGTTALHDVLKTLDLNVNLQSERHLTDFYARRHEDRIVYGPAETWACLEAGQLQVLFSPRHGDADRCAAFGTTFVLVAGRTALEQRFRADFGDYGGITRWKLDTAPEPLLDTAPEPLMDTEP